LSYKQKDFQKKLERARSQHKSIDGALFRVHGGGGCGGGEMWWG
jgi:hypothetical protein